MQAAERRPLVSEGYARPHPQYVYAGMSLQRRLIGDMYRTVRELAGGAFQNLPSSEASFLSPETRAHTERYYQSTATAARDRVKLAQADLGLHRHRVRRAASSSTRCSTRPPSRW